MEFLKKIGGWILVPIAVIVIGYNFANGWLINPPQPRVFKDEEKLWVAEPSSPFLHYLFGFETLREARLNPSTGHYEFQKDGRWISVSREK
ncbi:MAG: hypothetical protein KGR46_11770 [Verrucomicrobia bacterium]|nr:hypothetical protein [Verrucomicrobiota bacterium]